MATKNYTLGRGKVYFSRFVSGTYTPAGFFYIGNTPEMNLTIASDSLDHYDSDESVKELDDSVALTTTRTGSLITDNIDPRNVALFFFGSSVTLTQASVSLATETLSGVAAGSSYQLGITASNPTGYQGVSKIGFNVALNGATLAAATGVLTLTGPGADGDTVTIGDITYTLRTVPVVAYDVDIGVDESGTAANLVAAIMDSGTPGTTYGTGTVQHPDVSAANTAGVLTATALVEGTAGNAIATTEASTVASWANATMTGGTGTSFIEGTDYTMNYDLGFLSFVEGGAITDGMDIDVVYSVAAHTRERVISGSEPVTGAMRYIANNPKGTDYDYYMPYVKVSPNGDYALKGDQWQQIPFNLSFLKTANGEAIYLDGRPAYA
jgi:hypothetical protein